MGKTKCIICILLFSIAAVILIIFTAQFIADKAVIKGKIASIIGNRINRKVEIGSLKVRFFPKTRISVKDASIYDEEGVGKEFQFESLSIDLDLFPSLWKGGKARFLLNNGAISISKKFEDRDINFKISNLNITTNNFSMYAPFSVLAKGTIGDRMLLEAKADVNSFSKKYEEIEADIVVNILNVNNDDVDQFTQFIIPDIVRFRDINISLESEGSLEKGLDVGLNIINDSFPKEDTLRLDCDAKAKFKKADSKDKLVYSGDINIREILLNIPYFYSPLLMSEGTILFRSEGANIADIRIYSGMSDLALNIQVEKTSSSKIIAKVISHKLMLDQLLFWEAINKEAVKKRILEGDYSNVEGTYDLKTMEREKLLSKKNREMIKRSLLLKSISDFVNKYGMNAKVEVSAIKYFKGKMDNFNLNFIIENDLVKIDDISFKIFNGDVNGLLVCGNISEMPSLDVFFTVKGIDMKQLASVSFGFDKLEGELSGTFSMEGVGDDILLFKKTLSGHGEVQIDDCVIKGWNLKHDILENLNIPSLMILLPGIRNAFLYASEEKVETDFGKVVFEMDIEGSRVVLKNFKCRTPDISLEGYGTIDGSFNCDFHFKAILSEELTRLVTKGEDILQYLPSENGGLLLPLVIKGDLRDPEISPDIEELLKLAVKKTVMEGAKNLFKVKREKK